MQQAYEEYVNEKISGRQAAIKYGISYQPFLKYIKSKSTKPSLVDVTNVLSDNELIQMNINGTSLSFNKDILKDIIGILR
jgi:hypothetical protein